VRFALAVIAAGVTQLFLYLIPGVVALTAFLYVLLASLGAGFFARRRGWLAGALSVLLGAALYGLVTLAGPNASGQTLFDRVQGETALLVAVLPYAVIGAVGGAVGEGLRARVLAPR
jgi:apolipoprotein N-acyltransferase